MIPFNIPIETANELYSIPVLSLNASRRSELGSDLYDLRV